MAELTFDCLDVAAHRYAAMPTLDFTLRVSETTGQRIHAVALRCQIRIQPRRREYSPGEAELLRSDFGPRERWGDTLKPVQFATVQVLVPGFTGATETVMPVPCTYDFEVSGAHYLASLDGGEVPLLLLFSGTVFVTWQDGFGVEPVPWHCECDYRMPTTVWRELMDQYFPNAAWLRVHRDTFHALELFKGREALPTWDDTFGALLDRAKGTPS